LAFSNGLGAFVHEAMGSALRFHRGGNNGPIANFGGHAQSARDGDTIAKLLSALCAQYPYPLPYNNPPHWLLAESRPSREERLS
jgi:hypothetical protein